MTNEDQWGNDIVEAYPYSGAGLDLDLIITRGQHRARRKRNARRGASLVGIVALVVVGGFLVNRSLAESDPSSLHTANDPHRQVAGPPPTSTTTIPTTTTRVTSTTTPPSTSSPTASPPTSALTTTTPATVVPTIAAPVNIPVAVQSDAEMQAAGNNGPSSSILAPTSCVVTGTQVTARGGYTNGGFAPNTYDRFGAVVKLYVYTAPVAGYPQGRQIVNVGEETVAPIGGYGPWEVSGPIYVTSGVPARCVVASQPTHDIILAP